MKRNGLQLPGFYLSHTWNVAFRAFYSKRNMSEKVSNVLLAGVKEVYFVMSSLYRPLFFLRYWCWFADQYRWLMATNVSTNKKSNTENNHFDCLISLKIAHNVASTRVVALSLALLKSVFSSFCNLGIRN